MVHLLNSGQKTHHDEQSGGGLEASDQQLEWNEICSILECLVFTKEEVEENRPVAPRDVIMRLSELYRTSARAPARGSEGTKQPYSSNTKSAAQITAERHEEIEQPGITRPVLTNMLTGYFAVLPYDCCTDFTHCSAHIIFAHLLKAGNTNQQFGRLRCSFGV